MDSSDAIQFLILIILICLSAFFSSAETSMTTVNKIRIQALADQGDKRALTLLHKTVPFFRNVQLPEFLE